jgi:radical SAM protein with 4Fe4S-binding SPASM domain
MHNSTAYESELKNELSLTSCQAIIDDFIYTLNYYNTPGTIVFGGGDPLLREDFFDILNYVKNKIEIPVAVMGNSYRLDKNTAKKLKESGVSFYQISLDGMKDTHDFIRKAGSFDDAIRGFGVLKEAGISTCCMFTVSKLNMHQILDVIRLAAREEFDAFEFDRLVPVGSGKQIENEMIDPLEYKELLLRVNQEYTNLRKKGCKTHFGYKDNLWGLILDESDLYRDSSILPPGFQLVSGCLIGKAGLVILPDGNVMGCRRLPVIVGKMPESSIIEIFEHSEVLKSLKNASDNILCSSSHNSIKCCGCKAVSFCSSGNNLFACDPQCWLNS